MMVASGGDRATRVVLALNKAQATRPTSAAMHAVNVATRLASGTTLTVVCSGEPSDALRELWGAATVVRVESVHEWFAAEGAASDVLVVPGGRNGALATARVHNVAVGVGATVVVVADRASLASSAATGLGLGLGLGVTGASR